MYDPTQERPCTHCGVWDSEGQEHDLNAHEAYDELVREHQEKLKALSMEVSKAPKKTTAEIIDAWRDEIEAGL